VALEIAEGFVTVLRGLEADGVLGEGAVVAADMRDLSAIPSGSFHCVRNHASLHHLPVVPGGLGADSAVREARRVLAPGGVFYVFVKAGEGIDMIDTNEGLGGRFYQLFTHDTLGALLGRHGFSVTRTGDLVEVRPSGEVDWIYAFALAL